MDTAKLQKLNQLKTQLETWLESFKKGNFGQDSPELTKEAKEMQALLEKTNKVLTTKNVTISATTDSAGDWKGDYDKVVKLIVGNTFFANCFGAATDPLKDGEEVDEALLKLSAKVKAAASNWYGQYFDGEAAPQEFKATIAALHDRAKEVLTAKKKMANDGDGESLNIRFFGATTGDSRKVAQLLDKLAENFAGKIVIEKFEDKGDGAVRAKYNIEHLPTLVFKRGNSEFARHEGEISQSELEKKMTMMTEGASFSDSSNVITLDNQKTITDRELFSMGEFVVIYFDTVWSGACKKIGTMVQDEVLTLATKSTKTTTIRYENITIDGKTHIHKKFHVDKVPTIVYLRDGKEVGKHEGYINVSTLRENMRRFLANGSVDNSHTNEFDLLGIKYSEQQANTDAVSDKIVDKLSGSVGKGGKNTEMDVYSVQILLAQNGFSLLADGICGSQMVAAINEFQTKNGLEANGLVVPGDNTWEKLNG